MIYVLIIYIELIFNYKLNFNNIYNGTIYIYRSVYRSHCHDHDRYRYQSIENIELINSNRCGTDESKAALWSKAIAANSWPFVSRWCHHC